MASSSKKVTFGDDDFEKTLLKWHEEIESKFSDKSDSDSDFIQDDDGNTDSELESEINGNDAHQNGNDEHGRFVDEVENQADTNENPRTEKAYYGKNKYKWSSQPPSRNVRTPSHNIVAHLPGLKGPAQNLGKTATPLQIWKCIFTDSMANEIIFQTNNKFSSIRARYARENKPELKDLDPIEFDALLGILYYWSVFKANHEDLENLFATDGTGRDIFRCMMSVKRVLILLSCLRFDNAEDRQQRKENEPAAAISWLFNELVNNSQNCYSLGELTCIDEMLVGFRGRCKFRVYMPNKPSKYGIKIMILTDARTSYFYNAYVYTGKDSVLLPDEDRKRFLKPSQSVLQLTQPIVRSNRNVTGDNWFTSIELVEELQYRGLTYVGTLKKKERYLPGFYQIGADRKVVLSLVLQSS